MFYLTQGIVFGLYAALLPGPFQAFMLSKSLQNGWRHALPLALVPLLTDLPVMLLMLGLLAQVPARLIGLPSLCRWNLSPIFSLEFPSKI